MAVVLTYAASVPVVKVGRMAGQFGKPRSAATEVRDGVELPAYRGDAVNGLEFTASRPDAGPAPPARRVSLLVGHAERVPGLRRRRVRRPAPGHAWNQDFVAGSPAGQRYERLAEEIDRAIAFMHACGAIPTSSARWSSTPATRPCCWTTSAP
jgi:3-deoxy-D-arabino-heptulosonate 7-phosphate (DAHP) synthase